MAKKKNEKAETKNKRPESKAGAANKKPPAHYIIVCMIKDRYKEHMPALETEILQILCGLLTMMAIPEAKLPWVIREIIDSFLEIDVKNVSDIAASALQQVIKKLNEEA